jgi:D-alanyl-lipoteichoic acid acyltransferase DltB (MBOAT superfamily)
MSGQKLIGLGLILLCGLPALIAASEHRRAPALLQLPLAIAALGWSWVTGGLHLILLSLAAGAIVFLILVAGLAFTQRQWDRRLLTGSEVKLMTAAAMWLPVLFAVAAMLLALVAAVAWVMAGKLTNDRVSRPDLGPFVIAAVLAAFALA